MKSVILPEPIARARRMILAAIFGLAATACQPSLQELKREADRGVGGYTGQVLPFTVPYLLRYEATPQRPFSIVVAFSTSKGEQASVSMRGHRRMSNIGEQRLFEASIEEINNNGTVSRSAFPPLVTSRALVPLRGPIKDVDLDFPAFRQAGTKDIPTPGSDAYKAIVRQIHQGDIALPEQPVRMNDVVLNERYFAEAVLSELKTLRPPELQPAENTLAGKVIGLTQFNGAPHLVIALSGWMDFQKGRNSTRVTVKGHQLIDPKTALTGSMFMLATVTIKKPGVEESAEVFARYTAE